MHNINYDNDNELIDFIVKCGEIPRYIYKYTSLDTARIILKNSSIRFSKPSLFNDPFDCQLIIDTDNTDEEINEYVNQIAQRKGLSTNQQKEYRTLLGNPKKRFSITNNSIQQALNSMKVSCFTTMFDNLLMWAHYANKHQGVVLKFDVLKDASFFMTPYLVNYVNKYPIFNHIRDDYFKGKGHLAKLLVETKSLDWKYESEIRIMKPDVDISNPTDYYDFSINKEAIVEIIFGCQIKDEIKKEFVQFAKNNEWNNLTFRQSHRKSWKFELKYTTYLN